MRPVACFNINIVSPCIWLFIWWARDRLVFTLGANLVIRPIYIETPPPFFLDVSQEAVPSPVLSIAYNLVQLKLKCLIVPTITLLSRKKLHDCCRTDEDNKVLKILIYEYQAAVESSDTQLPTDPQNWNPYVAIISYTCTTRVFVSTEWSGCIFTGGGGNYFAANLIGIAIVRICL